MQHFYCSVPNMDIVKNRCKDFTNVSETPYDMLQTVIDFNAIPVKFRKARVVLPKTMLCLAL